jgi:acetyltransferase-like isoleucine patch superfamily enzyme
MLLLQEILRVLSGGEKKVILPLGIHSEMQKLKRFLWDLEVEFSAFFIHFLNSIPGSAGNKLRSGYYFRTARECGKNSYIGCNVRIQSPQNLSLGNNVHIASGAYLNASGSITLGSDIFIGECAKIWTDNHVFQDPTKPFSEQGFEYKPVIIEDDVWIGQKVFIKPGISIMHGAVIKAGPILAKNVPPYAIVEGNPGKIIGWRKQP